MALQILSVEPRERLKRFCQMLVILGGPFGVRCPSTGARFAGNVHFLEFTARPVYKDAAKRATDRSIRQRNRLTTLGHEAESKEFGTFPPVPELLVKPVWARHFFVVRRCERECVRGGPQ
jgi:hypothetical protein